MILAGDLGGTKTFIALFDEQQGLHAPVEEHVFRSSDFNGLTDMVTHCMQLVRNPITAATFGVAGPVTNGRATITNLPWEIDVVHLRDVLHTPAVSLINDLEAVAWSVPLLEPDDLHILNVGERNPAGPVGVIAPGTGLGEAYLTWDGHQYRSHASEGGHTSFGPRTLVQLDMLNFLMDKYGHVSYERVCSGTGIPNIYRFFREGRLMDELPWVAEALATANDPTPVIMQGALDPQNPSPVCRETLDMFIAILGAEAGNLALKLLATGGIYLGGGIPPRIVPQLQSPTFLESFKDKGRFRALLGRIPIAVILNEKAGLLGAARHAAFQHTDAA